MRTWGWIRGYEEHLVKQEREAMGRGPRDAQTSPWYMIYDICNDIWGYMRKGGWKWKDMWSTWSSKREWGRGRGLVTFKRGLLADGAPDGRPSTILQAGKILKLFFLNIHWISIRPQAYLDGHRTFLSKIETFTEVPFIISSTFFVNTEHYPQIDWEVNFSDLLNSQYIVQWKWTECLTVALIRASS